MKPHLDRMSGEFARLLQAAGWRGDVAVDIAQLDRPEVVRGLCDRRWGRAVMPVPDAIYTWGTLRRAAVARTGHDEPTALKRIAEAKVVVERWCISGKRVQELPIVSFTAEYGPDDWHPGGPGVVRHVLRVRVLFEREPVEDEVVELIHAVRRVASWSENTCDQDGALVIVGVAIDEDDVHDALRDLARAAELPCPLEPVGQHHAVNRGEKPGERA